MAKHDAGALRQLQSLPLEAKIALTEKRIREWYEHFDGQVYVSFSGGKDSTVLKHIVDILYTDVPSVFVNTGLEYPEIQRFVQDIKGGKHPCFNPDVEILRPEMRFDEVIARYGYPVGTKRVALYVETARRNPESMRAKWLRGEERTKFVTAGKWVPLIDAPFKVSGKCCDVMKKRPINAYTKQTGRKAFIGTMAAESQNREQVWLENGCNAFHAKVPISQPLAFWTEQDILHYIKQNNVPYAAVYGDIVAKCDPAQIDGQTCMADCIGCYSDDVALETTGVKRTGCMYCAFGVTQEKYPNRFQRMKVTHPRQWQYCMDELGLREVLEYIGVPYE